MISYKKNLVKNTVMINSRMIKTKKSSRILVFSELYYPEETSTGYFMTKISEGLTSDSSVLAICAQPSYSKRGERAPTRETHNGVNIRRYPSSTFDKDRVPLRLLNILSGCFSSFFLAIRSIRSSDVVLVVTNPPLLPFIIWLACKLRGAKFILRIDDIYPDMLNAAGMIERSHFLYRIFDKLNLYLYKNADQIVVLGRDMCALVLKKLGKQHCKRLNIIPNWGEVDQISPCPRENNSLLKELKIQNKFVVQYAGNMGYPHDIESIVEAAKILLNHSKIHFLFIGSGVKRGWLEDQISIHGLCNITLLDPRPRLDQSNFLNACDVTVSALIKGMSGISVPSRIYNIMAAGKPIVAIADEDSELGLIIREEKIGWIATPGNLDAFVNAILEAESNSDRLATMGTRAYQLVTDKYSKNHIVRFYKKLVEDVKN